MGGGRNGMLLAFENLPELFLIHGKPLPSSTIKSECRKARPKARGGNWGGGRAGGGVLIFEKSGLVSW